MLRGRSGIYAAIAAIGITVGLGIVGAAGADQAADGHVYARGDGSVNCFSDDPSAMACTQGETADVTINAGEKVTFHFEGTVQHNAVGSSWQAPPSGYASPGTTYDVPFPNGGDYDFI
jgi:plastocyanin